MPRPAKGRRICGMPRCSVFTGAGATGNQEPVVMTVEEYEAIRLIDHVGMTQEECAQQMAVARTTAQRIYNQARQKLAQFLIEGGTLWVQGGHYTICGQSACACREQSCARRRCACGTSPCLQMQKENKEGSTEP